MAETSNPLTPEHLQQINDALEKLDVAEKQAKLAERAGFDVSSQFQQIADNRARLLQVKQVYFPNQ